MVYLKYGNFNEFLKLKNIDLCSVFTACIVHDFRHPGYNNAFLSTIGDPIAIKYNDSSVLESYHISQTFKLIKSSESFNIFSGVSNVDYRTIRQRMIGLVLATDMIFHFKQFNYLEEKIATFSIKKGENRNNILEKEDKLFQIQQDFLEIVIHACDISNPTKPFDIYGYWAQKVLDEFFIQGDKEKSLGLPVSRGYDRLTTTLPQSQIGFIGFIVFPFFTSFIEIFPELMFLTDNLKTNEQIYKRMKEENDKQKGEAKGDKK